MKSRGALVTIGVVLSIGATLLFGLSHGARAQDGDFGLQITPTPLVATVKPGYTTELELKIRNSGSQTETLKIEPRSFHLDGEEVKLDETTPPEISNWISFAAPTFTVKQGEWFTQKVRLAIPEKAGFSYSFALLISRQNSPKPVESGRLIKGSVAVFTLVNIDRPGATRKIDVASFSVGKNVYEYLPADFQVQLKNSGNSIVQPYGNIYIQRSGKDKEPIDILPVNEARGYLLPDASRTLGSNWTNGFPRYETTTDDNGKEHRKLVWDWSQLSNLRIGRYTAKLVAVYNDGQRDIPLQGELTFWVIPWKLLGVLFILTALTLFGAWSLFRKGMIVYRRQVKGKDQRRFKVPKG